MSPPPLNGLGQFGIDAGGSQADLLTNDISWNPKWQARSRVTSQGWQTEIAIPFVIFNKDGSPASGWTLNLVRTRGDHPKSALVASQAKATKRVKRFAKLVFDPPS